MAKSTRSTDPLTADDLNQYLQSTDDFALELEIYRSCVSSGFNAEYGGTYLDQNLQKDRQFDVRATAILQKNRLIKLAIECKNLKSNHPILVSRIPRSMGESFHHVFVTFRDSTASSRFNSVNCPSGNTLFQRGKPVGKSLKHVAKTSTNPSEFSDKDSEIYDKWTQAIASAAAWLPLSIEDFSLAGSHSSSTVFLPVLVVSDDTLWVVDYDTDGTQLGLPHLVSECDFYIGKPVDVFGTSYVISHFQIFTRTAFSKQLSRLTSNDHYLDLLFPDFARYHGPSPR